MMSVHMPGPGPAAADLTNLWDTHFASTPGSANTNSLSMLTSPPIPWYIGEKALREWGQETQPKAHSWWVPNRNLTPGSLAHVPGTHAQPHTGTRVIVFTSMLWLHKGSSCISVSFLWFYCHFNNLVSHNPNRTFSMQQSFLLKGSPFVVSPRNPSFSSKTSLICKNTFSPYKHWILIVFSSYSYACIILLNVSFIGCAHLLLVYFLWVSIRD